MQTWTPRLTPSVVACRVGRSFASWPFLGGGPKATIDTSDLAIWPRRSKRPTGGSDSEDRPSTTMSRLGPRGEKKNITRWCGARRPQPFHHANWEGPTLTSRAPPDERRRRLLFSSRSGSRIFLGYLAPHKARNPPRFPPRQPGNSPRPRRSTPPRRRRHHPFAPPLPAGNTSFYPLHRPHLTAI